MKIDTIAYEETSEELSYEFELCYKYGLLMA